MKFSTHRTILISVLTLAVGMGMALALPKLARMQGKAAEPGIESPAVSSPGAANTIYVAKTGDGSAATLGWSTAYTNVQDAINAAANLGNSEIWVAAGVYYPDVGKNQVDNAVTSTFLMTDTVGLYGGFDISDTQFTDRDWVNNLTVLSGDIDGDDNDDGNGVVTDTANINGANAYNVVTARHLSGTAVLDGFTVTAGYASGPSPFNDKGGGLICDGIGSVCNPSLNNLILSANFAKANGGGVSNLGTQSGISSPILNNVRFINNRAPQGAGAMFNNGSNSGNSSPVLVNVIFSGNSAGGQFILSSGGAIYNFGSGSGSTSSPSLTNVIFSGNSATRDGGAMYNFGISNGTSDPSLTNVLFSGNSAGLDGGAIFNLGNAGETSSPRSRNVTFSGNRASRFGGAIYNRGDNITINPEIFNAIFWNNQDNSGTDTISATIVNQKAVVTITHSLVQGAGPSGSGIWLTDPSFVDGGGNIDVDPSFITQISPTTAPTTTGNLRLQNSSPAIDKGFNDYVIDLPNDLDGKTRVVDGDADGTPTVDMGAYEYQIPYLYDGYLPFVYR